MSSQIIFEQPLNERVRTFLRIEQLMQRFEYHISGNNAWDTHSALITLLEITDLVARGDVKSELMKELKRQIQNLEALKEIPEIDQSHLQHFINEHRQHIDTLYELSGHPSEQIKNNEFIKSIKQRIVIPGGTCDFDLPAYHYWLSQAADSRRSTLEHWVSPFKKIYETINITMSLIRNSASSEEKCAERGFYQQQLETDQPYQLIRLQLPEDSPFYAEISAGKHRFTVRFLKLVDPQSRASQTQEDIVFKLTCCGL